MSAVRPPVHQLKITLRDVGPPIWRRVTMPADSSLAALHEVIQTCFRWEDAHLHSFADPGTWAELDEHAVSLAEALPSEGARLDYTYDYGDDWRHRILLEKILPGQEDEERRVRCTGGRRAMPCAEDLGGAFRLQELLDAVVDPLAEVPGDLEELAGELREQGFDPAGFDKAVLDRELRSLEPQPPTASARRAAARKPRQRLAGGPACSCGQVHDDDLYDDDLDELWFAPCRPVVLAERAELACAVPSIPVLVDGLRLARWCADGRALTATGVLTPASGRQAVADLELWRTDPQLFALTGAEREQRLARMRSSADVNCLDKPWQFALFAELLDTDVRTARPGPRLAELDALSPEEQRLDLWTTALIGELDDVDPLEGVPHAVLRALGLLGEDDGLATVVLRPLYELAEGEWFDLSVLLDLLSDSEVTAAEERLLALLMENLFLRFGGVLQEYGAAEWEAGSGAVGTSVRALSDARTLSELVAIAGPAGGDPQGTLPGRIRLTPLGRHGVREWLLSEGIEAPLVGELADADAEALLAALLDYGPDAAEAEIAGWIAYRGQGAAAVQILDVCGGVDPQVALLRMSAPTVLAALDEPRSLAVLRKAAASGVPGCAQLAATALSAYGEELEGAAAAAAAWLLVDHLWAPQNLAPDGAALADFLRADGAVWLPLLEEAADHLWRCDHPATREVLETAGRVLSTEHRALAKRLRRSATKAVARR
ncbi:plasmid pRiA4b ORF-3 family protein [Kitasatospora misakiensis]|uniref:Plasmid pRiA4b ORF-3 family protein n=1 Tax=Kitasatospora misakiensis TaxID=67330 RepID=A0ABW0X396_9ACTN